MRQEGRRLGTCFPPPAGFCGTEHGDVGDKAYRRTLTDAEIAALEDREARRILAEQHDAERRRDLYFGFPTDPSEG